MVYDDEETRDSERYHDRLRRHLEEFQAYGRIHTDLYNYAIARRRRQGRSVPEDDLIQIRKFSARLQRELNYFQQLEWFEDDVGGFIDRDGIHGYRLAFDEDITVLMLAGNKELFLHFRQGVIYITLGWNFEKRNRGRAVASIYASAEEALDLFSSGIDGIERGYTFVPDESVPNPFPELDD
jgi:hypothetical protein